MAFQFRDLFTNEEEMSPPPGAGRRQSARSSRPAPAHGSDDSLASHPNNSGFQPVSTLPSKAYIFHPGTLTELIPDHLLSTAATPKAPITLQLPVSAEDPDAQLLNTTLSRIYKACPHLFAQPISESNDCEITLPLPVGAAGTVPGRLQPKIAPPPPGASPFSVVERPDPSNAHANGNGNGVANGAARPSPFQVAPSNGNRPSAPQPVPADFNPFEVNEQPKAPVAAAPAQASKSPFKPIVEERGVSGSPTTKTTRVQTPFQVVPPYDDAEIEPTPPPAPVSRPPSNDSADVLVFGLPQLLRGIRPQLLGLSLESIPPSGQARIPLESIKNQLATGRVSLRIDEILGYVDDLSRQALLHANPSAEISIPLKDIFHQLPSEDGAEPAAAMTSTIVPPPPSRAAAPASSSTIETPFSDAARAEARQVAEITPPAANEAPQHQQARPKRRAAFAESAAAQASNPEPEKNPFRVAEPKSEKPPAPAEPASAPAPAPADNNPFAEAQARTAQARKANPNPAPPAPPATTEEINPFLPAPEFETEQPQPGELESLDEIPARPSRPAQPVAAAVPTPAPAPTRPAPAPAPAPAAAEPGFGGLGFEGPMRDVELRALFGGSEVFTFNSVLDRVCQWSDVEGAVVIRGGALAASRADDKENQQLASRAPAIYSKVRNLASDLGFSSSEAFTLKTGRGVISFFSEGETCLSILHRNHEFQPGIREKLLLVARGVAQLAA